MIDIPEWKDIDTFYDSAIDVITNQLMNGFDNAVMDNVMKVTCKYNIDIDEKKLLQSLQQDRERYVDAYKKGYKRGYIDCRDKIMAMLTEEPEE